MKYLKKFENHDSYESFITSGDYPKPNVSYCVQENEVHYNPYVPPMNVITYQASEKLTETTAQPYPTSGFKTNAFSGSSGQRLTMKSHTFENGVGTIEFDGDIASIGKFAFLGCSSLTSITIPNSVTSIGDNAFDGCSSLTSIEIPNSVTSIGQFTFEGCSSLTSCMIGGGVTSIGQGAFFGCSSLTSITSFATTAPTIQSRTFRDVKTNGTLYVPSGSSGYDVWMGTSDYYLGSYGWTKVEQ